MAQSFESPEGMATIKLTRFDNPEQMRALLEQQYQQRMVCRFYGSLFVDDDVDSYCRARWRMLWGSARLWI